MEIMMSVVGVVTVVVVLELVAEMMMSVVEVVIVMFV